METLGVMSGCGRKRSEQERNPHYSQVTDHKSLRPRRNYMLARYYTSGSGRFLQVDPGYDYDKTDPMSFNLYGYVRENPVILLDPTGKEVDFTKIKDLRARFLMKKAWKKLKKNGSKETKYIMKQLESSPITHFVVFNPNDLKGNHVEATSGSDIINHNKSQPSSSTLVIQYPFADGTALGDNGQVVPSPLDVTMSHEIKHMYDYDKGINLESSDEEPYAVRVENTYRKLIPGMPKRSGYCDMYKNSRAWKGSINFNHKRDWDQKTKYGQTNRQLYNKFGSLP